MIRQAKINQFGKLVEILEEQYIDKGVTKESSHSPNRSPRTVEMHQVRSIGTVDNISVNRQRQVPRTGIAQWQDIGDVRCEGNTDSRFPSFRRCRKRMKSYSEITQSKDKCQIQKERKLAEVHRHNCGRSVVLKRHCQSSAQALDQVPMTGARLTRNTVRIPKVKIVGVAARVHDRERQESSEHAKTSSVRQ